MDDTQGAREAIMLAVDAYDAARLAFHGQSVDLAGMSETNKRSIAPMIQAAIDAYLSATRSIPAAAALLREAGWTVEEPKCETCGGTGRVSQASSTWREAVATMATCPTCKGTGAREAGE